jgi:hypothetical protein
MRTLDAIMEKGDVSKDEQLKSLAAFKLNVMTYIMQAESPFTVGQMTSIDSIIRFHIIIKPLDYIT